MNTIEKKRAEQLVNERRDAQRTAAGRLAKPEVPAAIQRKAQKIRALALEVIEAGYSLDSVYVRGDEQEVDFRHDHPALNAWRDERRQACDAIDEAAKALVLDIWSGRVETFAEVEERSRDLSAVAS